ncbi:MAG: hypothetical protein ACKOW9_01530 [Candidatus Paceibacterota bacterium]
MKKFLKRFVGALKAFAGVFLPALATALLQAPICCEALRIAAIAGWVNPAFQFSGNGYEYAAVLMAWPMILFVDYRVGKSIIFFLRKKTMPNFKQNLGFWINLVFGVLPWTTLPSFIASYLIATRKMDLFSQIGFPFVVWPIAIFNLFLMMDFSYRESKNNPWKSCLAAILAAALYLSITQPLALWVQEISQLLIANCTR